MIKKTLVMALGGCIMLAGSAWAAGNISAGKNMADDSCADCHGDAGQGDSGPALAGMSVEEFTKVMNEFKSGAKHNHMMQKAAKKLSDQDIADLAAYYASLPK